MHLMRIYYIIYGTFRFVNSLICIILVYFRKCIKYNTHIEIIFFGILKMNFTKDIKEEIREFEEGLRRIKYNLIRAENQQSALGKTHLTRDDLACPIGLHFGTDYDYKADKAKYEHVIGRMFCIHKMIDIFDVNQFAAVLFGDFEYTKNTVGRINYYIKLIFQIINQLLKKGSFKNEN